MKIRLSDLVLTCKNGKEVIKFADVNYFYGQMGAGKSTIARLIDYCLGGNLEKTPALQSEFTSASLSLLVDDCYLVLDRNANENRIRAHWSKAGQQFEILIPAKKPEGEILPGTGIEVLSDLIFSISDRIIPKVRRSKTKDDSDLGRLSFRDLLWYCYLDQDLIDSSFFYLEKGADQYRQLKSRDVIRFIVGFHQEQVAELETRLDIARHERVSCEVGATAIREALSSTVLTTDMDLIEERHRLEGELEKVNQQIAGFRDQARKVRSNDSERLQNKAREYSAKLINLDVAINDIREIVRKDKAHINELLSLSTRFRRTQSAREILGGVEFKDCPKCCQVLPARSDIVCQVCGQPPVENNNWALDEQAAEQDVIARVAELKELVTKYELQLHKYERQFKEIEGQKYLIDEELIQASAQYDSLYLSTALEAEKRQSALRQELLSLNRLETLMQRVVELEEKAEACLLAEREIRRTLKDIREKAEKDTRNLDRLKKLFLDCLLRARIPGFLASDIVKISPRDLLPEVSSSESGDLIVTSFATLGSGGKKTLFKCCFAVAMHRLSVEIGAILPSIIIIDSPMKNISERENVDQFVGFHEMLYQLCQTELSETQLILIDKEHYLPPKGFEMTFTSRHMQPNSTDNPPLIGYYRGK